MAYAEIENEKIVIRKNEDANSKIIASIAKEDIVDFELPKFGAMEAMLTGFKGLKIKYRDGNKEKTSLFGQRVLADILMSLK